MIGLLQRVSQARVTVDGEVTGEIGPGLLVLLAVEAGDSAAQAERLVERLVGYRVFPDAAGRMNLSLADTGGGLLLVPGGRPTYYEDAKGRSKPAFDSASSDLGPAYASKFKWTGAEGLPGLRANVYWKQDGHQARLVMHVLNYDVPPSGEPGTVRNFPISFALPDSLAKATIGKLSVVAPDSAEPALLQGEIRDGNLSFELPELRVYRIAEAVLTGA